METVTIAIAKGRLGEKGIELFKNSELAMVREERSRKLIFTDGSKKVKYIFVKPADVVTYVEKGVADLGIVGKDIILEEEKDVYEIADLGYGKCNFAVAGLKKGSCKKDREILRIASKYPNYVRSVFENRNQKIEIIRLSGSVELAPLLNLSDVIVDIVETGKTLRDNGLEVIELLDYVSARLIANKASYRFKYNIIKKIERMLGSD